MASWSEELQAFLPGSILIRSIGQNREGAQACTERTSCHYWSLCREVTGCPAGIRVLLSIQSGEGDGSGEGQVEGVSAEQVALQEVQMKPKKKLMLRLHETGFLHVGKINGGTPKTSTLSVFLTSLYSFVTAATTEYPKHTAHDRAHKQFLDAEMYFQYE